MKDFTPEQTEKFDRYLQDQLSEKEKEDFLSQLEADHELASKFEDYKEMRNAIFQMGMEEFSNEVAQWESRAAKRPSMKRWWLAVAASILVMASWVSWSLINSRTDTEELYSAYYQPFPDVVTDRSTENEIMNTAMAFYNQGNWKDAVKAFTSIAENSGSNHAINFYLAQCYIQLLDASNAREKLLSVSKNENYFQDASSWYLGLLELREGNLKIAILYFEDIANNPNSSYHKKAKELLIKLRN